jgi:hypothetical protein
MTKYIIPLGDGISQPYTETVIAEKVSPANDDLIRYSPHRPPMAPVITNHLHYINSLMIQKR